MKDTLLYILSQIVDHPEAIVVDEMKEETRTVLVIHAHKEDMGKIIGKKGRIITALRDIIKLMATKEKVYVDVEIADENPSLEGTEDVTETPVTE